MRIIDTVRDLLQRLYRRPKRELSTEGSPANSGHPRVIVDDAPPAPPPAPPDSEAIVSAFKVILRGVSWVAFRQGSCALVRSATQDPTGYAIGVMREFGPVHVGSPAGDFAVHSLKDNLGHIVTSHHDDLITHVAASEASMGSPEVVVGLMGRAKRNEDSRELEVIYVHNEPPSSLHGAA